ncbi:MGH1-like glycoside hydrolase domain-containing protein [Rhodohalobacter sulfatireducens]|uniref:Discoidin domain-containing protein n=1 Tax=Rhodohalobacter sulfatireducens TaxID=2911366 RepID=A0ABS9KDM4_9BACT|nr:discoidin domain-containing protein [Rhodohalobacter sulfatireducens]MCG2588957.1 discoidin domain-containing protein [Rhodohalobacter sulfatireducens]
MRTSFGIATAALMLLGFISIAHCQTKQSSILDKQEILDRYSWWDNQDWDWYKENIPFFDSPDSAFTEIYYYRWEVMTKHLIYGSPEHGYTFTEFINRPFWSGTYGAISCPLGHQFYEVRWLKNPQIVNDFARYWFEVPGAEPRSYSNWYGDSMWAVYKVNQDKNFLETVYPYMIQQYNGFEKEHFEPGHGMFMWDGMHDGMELNINGRQTDREFDGGDGFRPTLNSYMYADLLALSKASALLGETDRTKEYTKKAEKLKERVQEELWNQDRQFFFHQFAFDEKDGIEAYSLTYETGLYAGSPHGREAIGFVPWQFNLPDPGYEEAWKYLMDENYFYSEYGPTTTERNDPQFLVADDCCVWSGNSWPYANTQTLVAMANLLNNYDQDVIDNNDYLDILQIYAKTHEKDGRPYIAEAADPFTGSWEGHDDHYHSEHYLHSGYINNVITGLVGLRPQAENSFVLNPLIPEDWDYFALEDVDYHGHSLSIVWDRHGSHYNRGQGLMIFVDGEKVKSSETIQKLEVSIEPVEDQTLHQPPVNYAVNNGRGFFPHITVSSYQTGHSSYYANEGNYWYHETPANRWVSESGSDKEWIAVDFGVERPINEIKLYFLDDGEEIVPPTGYEIQTWNDDKWQSHSSTNHTPQSPVGKKPNIITFTEPQNTSRIRVQLTPQPNQAVGLTELEAWGPAEFPLAQPTDEIKNLAYNPDGKLYPIFSASYTSPGSSLTNVSDMMHLIPYNNSPAWTSENSPNKIDWIEINLGPRKPIQGIDIIFAGDRGRAGAPASIEIQYLDQGEWNTAEVQRRSSEKPTPMALNTFILEEPVVSNKIRLMLTHRPDGYTGISEIMVWSDDSR